MSGVEERLIGEDECRSMSGLSRAQRWRLEQDGKFPARVKLGPHTVRWRFSEILGWIANLPTADAGPGKPPQLHGRRSRTALAKSHSTAFADEVVADAK